MIDDAIWGWWDEAAQLEDACPYNDVGQAVTIEDVIRYYNEDKRKWQSSCSLYTSAVCSHCGRLMR
jgi:hypothetical protein